MHQGPNSFEYALAKIRENPYSLNVEQLEKLGLRMSWEDSLRLCQERSRISWARVEGEFAYVCGFQEYGPLTYNAWSFFSEGLAQNTRMVLRDFKKYHQTMDHISGHLGFATAKVPEDFIKAIRFLEALGYSIKAYDEGSFYLQRHLL